MAVKLVTSATSLPVTLATAKAHLRVDSNDEDALIDLYVAAATSYAERFCGRAFSGGATWDYSADAYPANGGAIVVPLPPLQEVLGLFYLDGSVELEFPAASYRVDNATEPGRVLLTSGSWPASSLRMRYLAGYATDDSPPVENVPPDVRNAILLLAGTLYDNRETIVIGQTVMMLPWAAEQLLRFHRVHTALA